MKSASAPIKRTEFFESMETYASMSKSSGKPMALILVDIENFEQVNKEFGYQTAEVFISSLFSKVEVLAKFFNCVFRINDSMFALILPVIESENMLPLAANKILGEIKNEFSCNNTLLTGQARTGMAVSDEESPNAESIYKKAEKLLKLAQEKSEDFILSNSEEKENQIDKFSEKFRSALSNNEFELYFQPKQNLMTGKTLHSEALLRWNLEDEGFINPEDIILEAEKANDTNFNLTKWVVNRALRQLKTWRDEDIDISVSINISASLIHRNDLITMIEDSLKIWSVPPSALCIEITETAFMTNKELCHENLNSIRDLGIDLSIDDFGTGYSSLAYFKEIPAKELKIDKTFILNLTKSKEDRKLVRLMIEIAHAFNLRVVAEGIEDEPSYNYLRDIGCDYAQGFYLAKPLPADDFIEWLKAN